MLKDKKCWFYKTSPLFDAPGLGDPFRILWWNLATED